MIAEFKRRPRFFPVRWANAVVEWICGVCSPSGTVKVRNTLNPNEGETLELDIDVRSIADAVKGMIAQKAAPASSDGGGRGDGGTSVLPDAPDPWIEEWGDGWPGYDNPDGTVEVNYWTVKDGAVVYITRHYERYKSVTEEDMPYFGKYKLKEGKVWGRPGHLLYQWVGWKANNSAGTDDIVHGFTARYNTTYYARWRQIAMQYEDGQWYSMYGTPIDDPRT